MRKTKHLGPVVAAIALLAACLNSCQPRTIRNAVAAISLDTLLNSYWQQRMQLYPLEATASGDYRYNDRLTITISNTFRDSLRKFYSYYKEALTRVDSAHLNEADRISYRLLAYETSINLEGLEFPTHLMPMNQFWAFTLELPQLGAGSGNQPFHTKTDYDNWLKRLSVFPSWTDTAIGNMRQGLATGWVLPTVLVEKMLPQLQTVIRDVPDSSIFYGPIRLLSNGDSSLRKETFGKDDFAFFTRKYNAAITDIVNPSYKKLYNFLHDEYLPASRSSSGVGSLPNGAAYYQYCIRLWTTSDLRPDSIFAIGEQEVKRIEGKMKAVKDGVGFKGDLPSFFSAVGTDKQYFPFTTAQQIIDSFWNIKKVEDPMLLKLFNKVPKTEFTIRQTEAFRAASASAEYNPGTADGSRPGVFFVPIVDASKFNAVGMETLFLHEAIPGHHYQISLQQEDSRLPTFRRFLWYGAYGEGWALYSESLGKELGLYKNPYQYFGHLSDAMHRAIRLVVDVGLHSKGWTRDQAIAYMMDHERISKEEATAEIERYMALPGQALSYKIGELFIRDQRTAYEKDLGEKFNVGSFHDAVLKNGVLPLQLLAENLKTWAKEQQ